MQNLVLGSTCLDISNHRLDMVLEGVRKKKKLKLIDLKRRELFRLFIT